MTTTIPTQDQTLALTRAVHTSTLTTAQGEQVAVVLTMTIGAAMRVAAEAAEHADDRVSAAIVAGAWYPVSIEFERLLGLVVTG
jgi:hypothetical protein